MRIRDPQINMRIKKTRVLKGLSQRELAQRTGVSNAYVSRIEMGDRYPSVDVIRRMASVLEVQAHWLETGDKHGIWVYVTRDELEGAAEDGCVICQQHLDENQFVAA